MRTRVSEGCIQKKVTSARFSRLGDITNKDDNTKKLTSSSSLFLCAIDCACI